MAKLRSAEWYAGSDRNAYIHRAWMRRGTPDSRLRRPAADRDRQHRVRPDARATPTSTRSPSRVKQGRLGGGRRAAQPAGGLPRRDAGQARRRCCGGTWRRWRRRRCSAPTRSTASSSSAGATRRSRRCSWRPRPWTCRPSCCPAARCSPDPSRARSLGCGDRRLAAQRGGPRRARCPSTPSWTRSRAMIRSRGHCNTMGTASTMASSPRPSARRSPGTAGIPAPDSRLLQVRPRDRPARRRDGRGRPPPERGLHRRLVPQRDRRAGRDRRLDERGRAPARDRRPAGRRRSRSDDFDRIGSGVPLIVDLHAGRAVPDGRPPPGRRAARRAARGVGPPRPVAADGHRQAARGLPRADRRIWDREVIRTRDNPVQADAGIAVLRGNLAPAGAIIKPAAATPDLLTHRGRAARLRLDRGLPRPDRRSGPRRRRRQRPRAARVRAARATRACRRSPNMPLPAKLLAQGVRDMVRICDGRMSGTAYGTVVLHVAPEAAAGGPLALVRTGDWIELDVPEPPARRSTSRTRSSPRGPRARPRPPRTRPGARLATPLHRPRPAGRHRRGPRLPRGIERLSGPPRVPLTSGARRSPAPSAGNDH